MKVFKKVFAFAIALTAIAMASSAMAADGTATYDNAVVSLSSTETAKITGSGQATVAFVASNFNGAASDVYYINQDTTANVKSLLEGGVGLLAAPEVPTACELRVGGEAGTVKTFTISSEPELDYDSIADSVQDIEGRIGFDGTVSLNYGTISKLIFTLTSSEYQHAAVVEMEVPANVQNVNGTVTFGLEIDGIPENVTVELASVVAE